MAVLNDSGGPSPTFSVGTPLVTTLVYNTDPMYQTGKTITDDAATLIKETNTFWHTYEVTTSNSILPSAMQKSLTAFMGTCEGPLVTLLQRRGDLGVTLSNTATQVINQDHNAAQSFTHRGNMK